MVIFVFSLVLEMTLTFFGSLRRDTDTIGSLWETLTIKWWFKGDMYTFPFSFSFFFCFKK
jgi:hypothetical protein